jgi:hypothetical protein
LTPAAAAHSNGASMKWKVGGGSMFSLARNAAVEKLAQPRLNENSWERKSRKMEKRGGVYRFQNLRQVELRGN